MSPARKRFLAVVLALLVGGAVVAYFYTRHLNQNQVTYTYNTEKTGSSEKIELKRSGRNWFLVDETRPFRTDGPRRITNPLLLSHERLEDISRERWGKRNRWLAFRSLYVTYYTPFYRERFDRELRQSSEEIEHAYEYWKRERTP